MDRLYQQYFFHLFLSVVFTISLYELKFVLIKKRFFIFFIFLILAFLFSTLGVRGYSNNSFYYFLWIMLVVWLSDIGGYLFGNIFKGPALSNGVLKKLFQDCLVL